MLTMSYLIPDYEPGYFLHGELGIAIGTFARTIMFALYFSCNITQSSAILWQHVFLGYGSMEDIRLHLPQVLNLIRQLIASSLCVILLVL